MPSSVACGASLPSTDALSASKRASKCSTGAFSPKGGSHYFPEVYSDALYRLPPLGEAGTPQA